MGVEATPFEDLAPAPSSEFTGPSSVEGVPVGTVVTGSVAFPFAPQGSIEPLTGVPFAFAPGGVLATAVFIAGGVPFPVAPVGSPAIPQSPSSDPEGEYRRTGHRPAFPLLARSAAAPPVPSGIGDGESFLVAPTYVPTPGDGMYEQGAAANYVGTAFGASRALSFRAPRVNDVLWLVDPAASPPDVRLARWDGGVWQTLVTMPQRALRGQEVFALADPDGLCDYFAKLAGAMGAQAQTDNASLADLLDPEACPADYLGLLAYQLGVPPGSASADDAESYRRARARTAVADARRGRGTAASFVRRLAQAGYVGYVREVWVNPVAADNWYSIYAAPPEQQAYAEERGIFADVSGYSGQKGQDWIEVEHGSTRITPTTHWPSGGLSVHLNRRDGSPIPAGTASDTVSQLKSDVARLLSDLLPSNVYIRLWATDVDADTVRYL